MKQLYCPHRVTVSGILQYCSNGKSPMDCEHCDCPDKKEFDVTVTTSSSEILSNKMKSDAEVADDLGITPSEYRDLVTNALFEEKPKSKNMTREEEIKKQAQGRILLSCNFDQNLIGMAEWADKTMLDKIEEILLSKVLPCFMHGGDAGDVIAMLEEKLEEQSWIEKKKEI